MRVIGKTIQEREARLNCKSLLAIGSGLGGNPQSVSVTNPNLNVALADFTVSMVVEAQGAWSVGLGAWQVSEADFQPTHLTYLAWTATEMFVNSERVGTHSKSWDGIGDLLLSATQYIQHLKIANRSWTQEEIRADRWQPGYAPASTHASILAHYAADREGMTMWDVVGQYNYAKAAALTAHHATLQNYTPAQVDTESGTNSAYLDFYDKTIYKPYVDTNDDGVPDQPLIEKSSLLPPLVNALRFDAASSQYASVANFNPTKENGYTLMTAFHFAQERSFDAGYSDIFLSQRNSDKSKSILLYGSPTNNGIVLTMRGDAGQSNYTTGNVLVRGGLHLVVATIDENWVRIYYDSRQIFKDSTQFFYGFDEEGNELYLGVDDTYIGTRHYEDSLIYSGIAKGAATPRQVIELWNNSLLANPKASWKNLEWQLLPNFNSINDDGAGNYALTDNSPQNHTINLNGFTAPNLDPADPAYSLQPINDLR